MEETVSHQGWFLPRQPPQNSATLLNIAIRPTINFCLTLSGLGVSAILLSSPPGPCFQADACSLLLALLRSTVASQIPALGLDGPAETKKK